MLYRVIVYDHRANRWRVHWVTNYAAANDLYCRAVNDYEDVGIEGLEPELGAIDPKYLPKTLEEFAEFLNDNDSAVYGSW